MRLAVLLTEITVLLMLFCVAGITTFDNLYFTKNGSKNNT